MRLADGATYRNDQQVRDKDEHFLVADLNKNVGAMNIGLNYYGIYGSIIKNGVVTLNHSWLGAHVDYKISNTLRHGIVLYNNGLVKPQTDTKTTSNGDGTNRNTDIHRQSEA